MVGFFKSAGLGTMDQWLIILSFCYLLFFRVLQVENLVVRMMKWLKVGGFIFFRESCFHQSGDHKRKNNPTHYREPRFYTKVWKEGTHSNCLSLK